MQPLRRAGKLAAWTLGGALYVWFAAVGNAGRVKARKDARRRERQGKLSARRRGET